MTKQKILSLLLIFILVIVFSGCTTEETSDQNTDTDNESPNVGAESLTDEDWDYFVFSYVSGEDLYHLFNQGFNQIDNSLSLFDPVNDTFLLKLNTTTKAKLLDLESIALIIQNNATHYQSDLDEYTLSEQLKPHATLQETLFTVYQNRSISFLSVYNKINVTINLSDDRINLVDISSEMANIFTEDELITEILDAQINQINSIPDDEWDKWTKDRDWSFME